jgi:hypothetical protein
VDLVAARGEVEGDPAGPGAEVEHRAVRPSGVIRQRAPQRQVGGVGAALDVVPDHVVHELAAAPRRTSSSRSSSIAVYVGIA